MTNNLDAKKTVVKAAPVAKVKKKRKKAASLDKRKAKAGWFFVLPFVIGFAIVYLPVVLSSLWSSFCITTNLGQGRYEEYFVGFQNYHEAFFVDLNFSQNLISGLQQLIFDVPAIIIFSLFMAVLLNQKMAGRAFFRAVFFVPVILSTGLMETIASYEVGEYSDGTGDESTSDQLVSAFDLEVLFSYMKIGGGLLDYVTEMVNNIFNIVNRSGVQMLIFLSGLQSISPAIYESCQIDGATSWETFWKITFPMIGPMILVNAVYTVIDSFTTNTNVVMKYINDTYITNGPLSTAMAWVYFLIVIVIIGLVGAIGSTMVFYQRRD